MSRRSSVSSTGSVSTSAKSSVEDDPLMRDCYDLRRRLLQTEQSLQSMRPPTFSDKKARPSRSQKDKAESSAREQSNYNGADELGLNAGRNYSSSPESAQILTLSDLTPPAPGSSTDVRQSTMPVPGYSFKSSLPDIRNGSAQSSPRDVFENQSFGSDHDYDTLRKKLNKHREENSQLVSQNHKLMSELENMSFELHQARNKKSIVGRDLDNERATVKSLEDRIVDLESELAKHEDHARVTSHNFKECQEDLHSKEEELRSVLDSSNIAETELREESKLRKRTEAQLQDALTTIDELTDKLADQDTSLRMLRQQSKEQEKDLKEALNQSQKESSDSFRKMSAMEAQIQSMKEEIQLLQHESTSFEEKGAALQQENTSLRTTISRQSQKIGRLENEVKKGSPYSKDTKQDLQSVIDRQQEKILAYQQEIQDTKNHMARLEDLVHRVQEQSMKEHVTATPSTTDSGYKTHSKVNGYSPDMYGSYINGDTSLNSEGFGSPGKTRALIADLKLKLAVKDAEIQKLQASAVARAAAQQKHIAGLSGDGGTMDNLRSELSAIVERSRMGDRKQYELEQMVMRLEDEITRYSSQNIQLEERLADKMSHVASMEEKLGQRNLRIVDLQKELEEKISEINELLRDIRQKENQMSHLERQLGNKHSEHTSMAGQFKTIQEELKSKANHISELEETILGKNTEIQGTAALVEKVKCLHSEQCEELQEQIEQLQKKFEDKSVLVLQLETELTGAHQELLHMSSIIEKLEKNLKENIGKLSESEGTNKVQTERFADIEKQAEDATKQMKHLQSSLCECQDEIKVYMQQLDEMRREHEDELQSAHNEMSKLQNTVKQLTTELHHKTAYVSKLEQALSEKEASLQKEKDRSRELQESRVHLQQQVTLMEEELRRERKTSQYESKDLHSKLQEVITNLDHKSKENDELNTKMKEMHGDLKNTSANIVELEHLLQESRSMDDKKTAQLQTIEVGYKETRGQLSQQTKLNGELEEHIRHLECDLKEKDQQIDKQDKEVNKFQGELQDTIAQLKSLEELLHTRKDEVEEKQKKVSVLDKMLNESVEELQQREKDLKHKETQIAELDQALKDSQKEIKSKDTQVSHLDLTMKEHRTEQQQKVVVMEHSLNQARYQLSERAVEIAELRAKLDQTEESLRQKKTRLEHYEKTAKQQQMDMKKRVAQMNELEKEADKLRKRRQDTEETSQELRLSREQLQNTHVEVMEARRELLKYQSREQEHIHELNDAHTLLTAKEHDCSRLAKDLGAAQVREAEAEARCVQEMRKSQQQHELKQVSQEQEVKRLQESHAKLIAEKEELQAEKTITVSKVEEANQQLSRELCEYKDANSQLAEEHRQIGHQLSIYQDELKTVNEAMVIKEAEIARLEARISGYERAMFGTRYHFDRLAPTSPRPSPVPRAHARHVTSPRALSEFSQSGMKKSISDHNLHNLSESSAYSLVETEDFLNSLDHLIEHGSTKTKTPYNMVNESPQLLISTSRPLQPSKEELSSSKNRNNQVTIREESDGLDPTQCRASLKERLRASEERRKHIDKQLHTMQSTMS